MTFEYFEETGRVLPVFDEVSPELPPSTAVTDEANRLEAAVLAADPRIELVPGDDGAVLVFWRPERLTPDMREMARAFADGIEAEIKDKDAAE